MELKLLPLNDPPLHRERHSIRLRDIDRLHIGPVGGGVEVIVAGNGVDGPPHGGDVDIDYFACGCVDDWTKVEWEGVLHVIEIGTVVEDRLLKANAVAETLVVTNCPCFTLVQLDMSNIVSYAGGYKLTITVDLVHVLLWNSQDFALLNHPAISPNNLLSPLQVLYRELHIRPTLSVILLNSSLQIQSITHHRLHSRQLLPCLDHPIR